jgi:hypothetical protein
MGGGQGVVEAESIKADLEVFDSEEYNRALFLADMHVILLVLPVTYTSFKYVSTHHTPHTAHRTPHTAHRTPHTAHHTPISPVQGSGEDRQ